MNKQLYLICGLMLVLFSFSFNVFAQQEKGDVQMQASLSLTSSSSSGTTTSSYSASYSVSKFFTKNAELGISYILGGGSGSSYNFVSPFFNLNLLSKNGRFVFYTGAQYLLSSQKFGEMKTLSGGVGVKAGIRSYVSKNIFYFVGPNLTFLPEGSTQFDLTAGIGVLFKKTKDADL
ncbi:MAG TPA: hypothetical protein VK508_17945 [Cyclobacteriaceae bacterium]|nr:hypothetical protein [Cyclobacteriaceae bacterium]